MAKFTLSIRFETLQQDSFETLRSYPQPSLRDTFSRREKEDLWLAATFFHTANGIKN